MAIHDISRPIAPYTVVWPGDPPVCIAQLSHLDRGDEATVSHLSMGVHAATHVDAPCHYVRKGLPVEDLDLQILVGPALVAHVPGVRQLSAQLMDSLEIPAGIERLLLRTANSDDPDPAEHTFRSDFVAFTPDGAEWLLDHGVRLVGIDGPSVALYEATVQVHRRLLGAAVILVEGLDLTGVTPGTYQLICLPLKLAGSDGAPARAILIEQS